MGTSWPTRNHTTSSCDLHLAFVDQTEWAVHAYGPDCDLPGTFWFTPRDAESRSYCYFGEWPSVRTREAVEAWLEAPGP